MAPQTRSTTKPSPGRSTRNGVYGRSPLPPTKPLKSPTDASPAKTARAQEKRVQHKPTSKAKGTPWLACRDEYGVFTTVAVSDTGEGVHVRWYYSEDDCEVDEEEADVEMMTAVDKERDVTPQPSVTAAPNEGTRLLFPHTPMAPQPYDAGSVILTPVKRAKPLQPSPPRIGDKGIRCLFEKDGVLRDFNGEARIVLRHPVGSIANLSREQVERLENEREERIVRVQVAKLLAERNRVEQERFSDSGYEDEMETDDDQSQRRLGREGANDTALVSQ